jgi:hypothetical protein
MVLDDRTKYEEAEVAKSLDQLRQQFGHNLPKEMLARGRELAQGIRIHEGEPVSTEDAPLSELEGIPVIAADDVAAYVQSLEVGTEIADLVESMAPPFDQFFVEFQRVPNQMGLYAWGAHFRAVSDPAEIAATHPYDNGYPRWVYMIETYLEKRKGEPCGPAALHLCGLAEDGTWFRHSNGRLYLDYRMANMSAEPPEDANQEWNARVAQLLFPALMALSFMHCKNVTLESVVPSEKLSRSYRKRHGRPLVSYGELRIDPIRKVLEQQRKGVGGSLRKALHLCRGHFKTFTADSPLLGHATGTYWWAPQVRGAASAGVTLKDYRVEAPSKIGRTYSDANEELPNPEQEAPRTKDPDSAGRGLAAHSRTQNYLASVVRDLSWLPKSPKPSEPQYDLAWIAHDMLFVCEVKSVTSDNERRQLMMATGQVILYRQQLTAAGHEPCFAVICTERQPSDLSLWDELCEREGIVLLWPEVALSRLKDAVSRRLN